MDGGGKVKRTATRSDLGIHPPEFRRLTLKVEVFSEYPATWLAGPSVSPVRKAAHNFNVVVFHTP
jgi:hypothetical protein